MSRDIELLHAWRGGDEAKGQQLCERYFEPVTRFFANKLGDQTTDLVQDTFLALVQGRDRIEDDDRFRSYVFSIAYNVLRKHIKQRYHVPEDFTSRSLHDLAPGAETRMAQAEQLQLLKLALRRIPLYLQVTLELRYWEGLSSSEISRVLDVPAATIRTHLVRGRRLLEEALRNSLGDPEVVDSTISDLDAWAERLRGVVYEARAES
ncbi:MAG: sigma-70 family RNA polymerase sigma factor [Myxococcota bacterium]